MNKKEIITNTLLCILIALFIPMVCILIFKYDISYFLNIHRNDNIGISILCLGIVNWIVLFGLLMSAMVQYFLPRKNMLYLEITSLISIFMLAASVIMINYNSNIDPRISEIDTAVFAIYCINLAQMLMYCISNRYEKNIHKEIVHNNLKKEEER